MTSAPAPPRGYHYQPDGPPQRSLGPEIFLWIKANLLQPDGPDAGTPLKLTPEQLRFLAQWYALDERGQFVYRSGVYRRIKGAGKTPFAAALCCVEFVGPCRFGGWKKDGSPLAVENPSAWVQGAAVSKDQTRNLFTLFPAMLSVDCVSEHSIDIGKEIIYAHQGARRIEAVTSSPRALEGGRASFTVKDENHHWIQTNEGHEMAAVIARNAAKSRDGSSRVLATTNAFAPGEGSDAERDWEAYLIDPTGMLYDSIEAPAVERDDTEGLKEAVQYARGDAHWLDVKRMVAEIQDPRTPWNTARRFYLNQLAASEDRAFDIDCWKQLERKGYVPPDGALITLGFDGSESRDHTPLIGTEVETGHQWTVGYWEPRVGPDGEVRIPVGEVDATVDDTFGRWKVWRMNCDPYYWGEQIAIWAGRYNQPGNERVVSWPTTRYKAMAFALAEYRRAIDAGDLTHDGDERFTANIGNAHKHEQMFRDDNGERMWTIQKERPDSPFKIDAAVAGCLSWEARRAAIASGALEAKPGWHGIYIPGGDR